MGEKISKRSLIVKVILSGCFFWILLSFVKTDQLVEVVSHIDWFYFTLSFLLTPVMLVVSCLKWKMILDLHEKKIPFRRLIRIYLIGYFFSNLLPSTVGGDVTRSYYSGKIIKNQSFSAIAIFIERFTGVFMLLILVIFSPLMKAGLYKSAYIYVPSIISITLILLIILIWRFRQSLKLLHRFAQSVFSFLNKSAFASGINWFTSFIEVLEKIYRKIYSRLEKLHDEMNISVTTIRKDRSLLLKIIFVTVLFYVLACLNVYLAFMAFGIRPEFIGACALVPTALFVAQVPVTLLGNMGFFESVFVFYFLLIGIPGAETLAMGLLLRLKMLTIGLVGYFVYLSYNHTKPVDEEIDQLAG
jgi:uncharacterized protein (TIRG00374 family)